jgi:hypothetical protein
MLDNNEQKNNREHQENPTALCNAQKPHAAHAAFAQPL